jgi:hypothetical protein
VVLADTFILPLLVEYAWYKVTFAAKVRSLSILDTPTSLSTMHTRQCVRFVLLRFRIAINNAFMVILCRWQQCKLYLGIHVKSPIFFSPILPKFGFSRQIFMKVSDIKVHEKPSSGSRADTRGRTSSDEASRGFSLEYANARKIHYNWLLVGISEHLTFLLPAEFRLPPIELLNSLFSWDIAWLGCLL